MKTTRLVIDWKDIDKIFDKYDIFECSYNVKNFKSSFEAQDQQAKDKEELKALSVCYKTNGKCLFLLDKDPLNEQKMNDFQIAHPFFQGAFHITKAVAENDMEDKYFLTNKRKLIQLLMNSLFMSTKEKYRYNNIDGSLLFQIRSASEFFAEKDGYLSFIKFQISTEMALDFPLVTFKITSNKNAKYVMDKNYVFRHNLGTQDDKLKHYETAKVDKHHNTAKFLNFRSFSAFENSKVSAIYQIQKKFNEKFSDFLTIDFEEVEETTINRKLIENIDDYDRTNKNLIEFFKEQGKFYLVNRLKDEEYAKTIALIIKNKCKDQLGIDLESKEDLNEDGFNIVIGHNRAYYEDNKIEDPYMDLHKTKKIQYITVEDYKIDVDNDPFFEKIKNEMQIKCEIMNGKLSHVINAVDKDWTFVWYDVQGRKKADRDEGLGEDLLIHRMKLKTDDTFTLDHFNHSDLIFNPQSLDEEAVRICEFTGALEDFSKFGEEPRYLEKEGDDEQYANGLVHFKENVEGLCFSDINNIHTILRTTIHTLPNMENLSYDLGLTRPKGIVDLDIVRKYIKEARDNSDDKNKYDVLLETLEPFGESIEFKELLSKKIFSTRAESKKWMNSFLIPLKEKEKIFLNPQYRSKDSNYIYEISNLTDIQYYYKEGRPIYKEKEVAKTIPAISYIAGRHQEGMETHLAVGSIIRDVVWQTECEFESLFKMMAVDFVRNPYYYSVLPFPFKYLHEYAKMVRPERRFN